jgi:hypothetical protein
MKIIITDLNGVVHEKCPRCGKAWVNGIRNSLTAPDVECEFNKPFDNIEKCIRCYNTVWMLANQYQLECYIFDTPNFYKISWHSGFCKVSMPFQINNKITKLPLLPYDISLEKLKTYILFS